MWWLVLFAYCVNLFVSCCEHFCVDHMRRRELGRNLARSFCQILFKLPTFVSLSLKYDRKSLIFSCQVSFVVFHFLFSKSLLLNHVSWTLFSMSSRINKEWIKENNFQTDAYKNGVLEFLEFVHKNMSGNKHSCPCRRCRNGTGHIEVGDIFVHLMEYGMVQDYTLWHFHGEGILVNQVHQKPQYGTVIELIKESTFPGWMNL